MKLKWKALLTASLVIACAGTLLTACGGKDLSKAEIELSQTEYVYNGTACMPDVTVTYGKQEIANSELYIEYSDNVNAGTATVTVTPATSAYKGSKTAEFTILPAESSVQQEVVITAQYNQTIGEVLGNYNIAESDKGYTEATVLTEIGEKTYSFRSLYTPADPNYQSVYQTVYITVTKAAPDSVSDLAKSYTAYVGDSYSSLDLPVGVEVTEPDGVFEKTGTTSVNVTVKQVVNGTVDDEHYNTLAKKVSVNVQPKEVEIGGNGYVYDSTAFNAADMTVNGDVTIESTYESYSDYTVSISFTFESLTSLDLHMYFDNVLESSLIDGNKQNLIEFDKGTMTSWLGGLVSNKDGTGSDIVTLPDFSEWEGLKFTVVSQIDPTVDVSGSCRMYYIYLGDSASDEPGTLMYTRRTDRRHQYRFQYIFTGAKNVTITDISFEESAYVNNKLIDTKIAQYLESEAIASEYANGGILMIGDSLVDYWGMDYDNKTASVPASTESFGQYAYEGPVVNLGVGASTAEDWINYFRSATALTYFRQLNPDYVYMLIGCNQIGYEDSKNISETVITLIGLVSETYPNAKIVVNSMMPTTTAHTKRWPNWYRLEEANELVKQYIASSGNDKLIYLDLESMFTPDPTQPVSDSNSPVDTWHASDGLHYRKAAYDVWARRILKELGLLTELSFRFEDADYGVDLSGFADVDYAMCNGKLILTLTLSGNYALQSILLDTTDITEYYDLTTGKLVYRAENAAENGTVTILLVASDDPDDNFADDDDFTPAFGGLLSEAEITLEYSEIGYDGVAKTPAVTVTLNGETVSSDSYSVTYYNNVNAGTATVRIVTYDDSGYAERELTFVINIPVEISVVDSNGTENSSLATVNYAITDGVLTVTVTLKQDENPLQNGECLKVSAVTVNGTDATESYNEETGTFEYSVTDCGDSAEVVITVSSANPDDNTVDDDEFITPDNP